MKVTIELPATVVQRLRSHGFGGERPQSVPELTTKKRRYRTRALELSARKANGLRKLKREMKDWEVMD